MMQVKMSQDVLVKIPKNLGLLEDPKTLQGNLNHQLRATLRNTVKKNEVQNELTGFAEGDEEKNDFFRV